jgi:hypothetical protein
VWHGFIAPQELQLHHLQFIFILIATIHNRITQHIHLPQFKKRPQLRFDDIQDGEYDFGLGTAIFTHPGGTQLLYPLTQHVDISHQEQETIKTIFENSFFILPGRHGIVLEAFKLFLSERSLSISSSNISPVHLITYEL